MAVEKTLLYRQSTNVFVATPASVVNVCRGANELSFKLTVANANGLEFPSETIVLQEDMRTLR